VPGLHRVDDNLYLQIKGNSRSWAFRYMLQGKARFVGLGSAKSTKLALALARDEQQRLVDAARRAMRAVKLKRHLRDIVMAA
jgi:hypothetical protein